MVDWVQVLGDVTRWALVGGVCVVVLAGCKSLPPLDGRLDSKALQPAESAATPLGRALAPEIEAHPGLSGIFPLADAQDAFAARVLLARAAERTLDVQYYIWRGDMTGTLLFEALHEAADRGVRVRLLLDDNNTSGLDPTLRALDAHPLIEVRLFNPFLVRSPRVFGFLSDFSRLNRRMHNKSFTADSQATIVGGRNIGDEYFGAGDGVLFADLDVIAVGPVVTEVSSDFDRYWASESSYPVGLLLPAADPEQLTRLATSASLVERSPAAASYVQAIRESNFIGQMLEGSLTFQWSPTRLVSDDPAKGLGRAEPEALLPFQLHEIIGVPRSDVELVSPYFVPTQAGVEAFVALAQMGVKVRILTNSLDATDVAAVHSGYAKHRRALLEAGIELYEMRRLNPEMDKRKRTGPFGSSGSSLHAKTFAVDRQRVFVGSFNFDPRSVNLNTELGLIIDNPVLAGQIDDMFNSDIARTAYEVRLTDDGTLYWIEQVGGQDVYHAREPGTTVWQRLGVSVLALLPIDWLL